MLRPNDLPIVCLPIDLSDEAAAKLVEFLHELTEHELTEAIERHYCAQLHRYYNPTDIPRHDLDLAHAPTDPPMRSSPAGRALSRSTPK